MNNKKGTSYYWTDASGSISCTEYLGYLEVEVIDVPEYVIKQDMYYSDRI